MPDDAYGAGIFDAANRYRTPIVPYAASGFLLARSRRLNADVPSAN